MADYKATAAQLASIANAIRLKGGTSTALEYPSEWITAIQNLVPASGGSEITPLDPTAIYKVTDTELISIANAIRAKGGTSSQLEFPTEFVSAIQNIPAPTPPIEIASWASGTDEQIVALLQAAHNGDIDLQQDAGWAVGDRRTISIEAFSDGDITPPAQTRVIVISSFDNYENCGCVMQFDFEDEITGYKSAGCMFDSTPIGGYNDSKIYNITLPTLVAALPTWLKNNLIEFSVKVATAPGNSTIKTVTGNKLALRSCVEVTGAAGSSGSGYSGEGSLIPYYSVSEKRIKRGAMYYASQSNQKVAWYLRSPSTLDGAYLLINSSGNSDWFSMSPTQTYGLSPFGC